MFRLCTCSVISTMKLLHLVSVSSLVLAVSAQYEANTALGKPCYQSTTLYPGQEMGSPGVAVDGKTGTRFRGQKTCTHTKRENQPWWVVDLGATYRVAHVKITNRGDCCANRLKNFKIKLGTIFNPECLRTFRTIATVSDSLEAAETRTIDTSTQLTGRYVMIQLEERDILTLCEVEVYGAEAEADSIATDLVATQSTDYYSDGRGVASLGVDGNAGTDFKDDSTCTHTKNRADSWWMVDLGQDYYIESVAITNRADCCSERLTNFNVTIGDGTNQQLIEHFPGTMGSGVTRLIDTVCRDDLRGRYLRVQLNDVGILTLCEVKVQGRPA